MTGFEWIGNIIEWFGTFIPRITHIKSTHRGVLFTGKGSRIINPGYLIYIPLFSEPMVYPVKRQTLDLPPQILTLKDGTEIMANVVVVFEIEDIHKFLVDSYDTEDTIKDISQGAVKRLLTPQTFEKIRENQISIDKSLARRIHTKLSTFGVKVIEAFITDLGKTKILRLVGGEAPVKIH